MNVKRLLLIAILGFSFATLAQGKKVGVFEPDVVIQNTLKGKAFFEQYEKARQKKAEELNVLFTEIQKMQKDYEAKAASLSEDQAKSMNAEFQRRQTELKRKEEDAKIEIQTLLNLRLEKFREELRTVVDQFAETGNYDLILTYGPASNIVYFSPTVLITQHIIDQYDAKYPAN